MSVEARLRGFQDAIAELYGHGGPPPGITPTPDRLEGAQFPAWPFRRPECFHQGDPFGRNPFPGGFGLGGVARGSCPEFESFDVGVDLVLAESVKRFGEVFPSTFPGLCEEIPGGPGVIELLDPTGSTCGGPSAQQIVKEISSRREAIFSNPEFAARWARDRTPSSVSVFIGWIEDTIFRALVGQPPRTREEVIEEFDADPEEFFQNFVDMAPPVEDEPVSLLGDFVVSVGDLVGDVAQSVVGQSQILPFPTPQQQAAAGVNPLADIFGAAIRSALPGGGSFEGQLRGLSPGEIGVGPTVGASGGGVGSFEQGEVQMAESFACGVATPPFVTRPTSSCRPVSEITAIGPDGKVHTWKNMGRPVLWSGDLSASKRVDKVARRAKRRRPR